MGFSTNITIQNDFWHEIKKDPQKLIDAISIGMNDGAGGDSPISDALDARDDAPEYRKRLAYSRRYNDAPQGVTVHRAQHNDLPQVIMSGHRHSALAAHELPTAISHGWLDLNQYNEERAEETAKELHRLAASIRKAARKAKGKKS